MQNSVGQQNIQQYQTVPMQCQCQPQGAPQQSAVPQIQQPSYQIQQGGVDIQQSAQQGQVQIQQPQGQNVQVPNYSGVNIQIFNPSVTPPNAQAPVYNVNAPNYGNTPANGCYPSNYYTNNFAQNPQNGNLNNQSDTASLNSASKTTETSDKKTEKREIVQLTDEYIKTLENYLNSQDKEVRLMGAKEVVARLEEDKSRKDDKALNALVNKMLQDPSTPVRILALSALDSRAASGDDLTVNILKQMQNSQSGYGQDALQASQILLKMSGQKVEKEFEVKENKKTETKETKTEAQNNQQTQAAG